MMVLYAIQLGLLIANWIGECGVFAPERIEGRMVWDKVRACMPPLYLLRLSPAQSCVVLLNLLETVSVIWPTARWSIVHLAWHGVGSIMPTKLSQPLNTFCGRTAPLPGSGKITLTIQRSPRTERTRRSANTTFLKCTLRSTAQRYGVQWWTRQNNFFPWFSYEYSRSHRNGHSSLLLLSLLFDVQDLLAFVKRFSSVLRMLYSVCLPLILRTYSWLFQRLEFELPRWVSWH